MLTTLQDIFREIFNDPELILRQDSRADEIAEWDSFNHVILIATLEERYGITFSVDEIVALSSVDRIIAALHEKGIQIAE